MRSSERAYYEQRAPEYDDWWLGTGLFAHRERPGWSDEVARLIEVIAALPPALTLDVACGTGFLTQYLRGQLTLLDQSEAMLARAGERRPDARLVRADVPPLPFADRRFERLFASHFYCHLREDVRDDFLTEARRVGGELIVVDSAGDDREEEQERVLGDGSRHRVYKRWFRGSTLAAELRGKLVLEGDWFVVVRSA